MCSCHCGPHCPEGTGRLVCVKENGEALFLSVGARIELINLFTHKVALLQAPDRYSCIWGRYSTMSDRKLSRYVFSYGYDVSWSHCSPRGTWDAADCHCPLKTTLFFLSWRRDCTRFSFDRMWIFRGRILYARLITCKMDPVLGSSWFKTVWD